MKKNKSFLKQCLAVVYGITPVVDFQRDDKLFQLYEQETSSTGASSGPRNERIMRDDSKKSQGD